MKQCVNNTIQKYLEDGINNFGLRNVRSLYEIYKDIRTTMAEKGMIFVKRDYVNPYYHTTLTNPKTIAAALLYCWIRCNGFDITQKKIFNYYKMADSTLRNATKILEIYIEYNDLELRITEAEMKLK